MPAPAVTGNAFELSPGAVFAGYRVEHVLGHGGMGIVYQAVQLSLDRPVALKVIAPEFSRDPAYRERFKREARLAAALEHPGVLPVYEHGATDHGLLYLSMRLTRGTDLGEYLKSRGPVGPGETVRLLMPVAEALDAAHAAGLVHRDVKPGNVLLEKGAGERRVYLTDFGLAKRLETEIGENTTAGQLVGTPHYMAPEQILGEQIDGRADIYALGCLLYRALVGQVPFERPSLQATLFAHLNDPPPKPSDARPGLPAVFDLIVARALEKDPERRARSATALLRRADAELGGMLNRTPARPAPRSPSPEPAQPIVAQPPPARGHRRGPLMAGAGMLAAIAVAVGALLITGARTGGDTTSGNDVQVLRLASETVRVAGQSGALVQRMSGATDAGGMTAAAAPLEKVAGSWRELQVRTRAELPESGDAAAARLAGAQRLGERATRGLLQVAEAPAAPASPSLVDAADRRYGAMLDRLRAATGLIQRRLDAGGNLSEGDRALLRTIRADLAAGRTTAKARFDALGGVVGNLSGG